MTQQCTLLFVGALLILAVFLLPSSLGSLSWKNVLRVWLIRLHIKRPYGYYDYLESPVWKELRRRAKARDGSRCRICDDADPSHLQVHHRRYPKIYGTETLDDLTTLCDLCHELISRASNAPR